MRLSQLALLPLLLAVCAPCQPSAPSSWVGLSAPTIDGANFVLNGRGHSPLLLAFLALAENNNQSQSRATAVILQSLDHQYRSRGLRVVAMDASAIDSHKTSHHADVVNATADWNLKFPVLEDPEGGLAKRFHIYDLPTVVLISADGKEINRWLKYTRTPVLAQAIERIVGGPLGLLPDTASQPEKAIGFGPSVGEDAFTPGALWLDSQGVAINAHGAGFLYHAGKYYWYGEFKTAGPGGNVANVGFSCYSSSDLYHWKNEGIALRVSENPASNIAKGAILERPKVLYNSHTRKYVMWFHLELKGQGYRAARVGVAISRRPAGPFLFLKSFRPDGEMSRDMTLFQDDDGTAYLLTASEENQTMHLSELSDDYLSTSNHWKRIFIGEAFEAPTILRFDGKYYFVGSHCTGWAPNPAYTAVSDTIWGPWKSLGNPAVGPGADKTFLSQGTYLLPVHGKPGAFIFAADRWNPENAIDGRYVWLPVEFTPDGLVIRWRDRWRLHDLSPTHKSTFRPLSNTVQ